VQPRHGAFPEIVDRLGNGLLCEPDDPVSLAAGIEQILTDPSRAQSLARIGRETVFREFGMTRMATDVLRVYNEALGHKEQETIAHAQ
jgi:glycosyltransferase involved in cell wall biosynthesis